TVNAERLAGLVLGLDQAVGGKQHRIARTELCRIKIVRDVVEHAAGKPSIAHFARTYFRDVDGAGAQPRIAEAELECGSVQHSILDCAIAPSDIANAQSVIEKLEHRIGWLPALVNAAHS